MATNKGLEIFQEGGLLGGLGNFIRENPELATGLGTGIIGVLSGMSGLESFGTGGQVMANMQAQKAAAEQARQQAFAQQQQQAFQNRLALMQAGLQQQQYVQGSFEKGLDLAKKAGVRPEDQIEYAQKIATVQETGKLPSIQKTGVLGRYTPGFLGGKYAMVQPNVTGIVETPKVAADKSRYEQQLAQERLNSERKMRNRNYGTAMAYDPLKQQAYDPLLYRSR